MPQLKKPSPKTNINTKRRQLLNWLWRIPVLITFSVVIWIIQRAYRIHFQKTSPKKIPNFVPQEPTPIAPLSSFSKVWDKVEFTLETVPAIVLHIPQPLNGSISVEDKHFIAFSRICTHLNCSVNFTSDVEAIALASNHRVSNPALICPCHLSLFDVLKAGKAISGPAVEPLPRIQLKAKSGQLLAVGIEK